MYRLSAETSIRKGYPQLGSLRFRVGKNQNQPYEPEIRYQTALNARQLQRIECSFPRSSVNLMHSNADNYYVPRQDKYKYRICLHNRPSGVNNPTRPPSSLRLSTILHRMEPHPDLRNLLSRLLQRTRDLGLQVRGFPHTQQTWNIRGEVHEHQ